MKDVTINYTLFSQLTDTHYRLAVTETCNMDMYRVMAINQFGTSGFSKPIQLPGKSMLSLEL